MPSRSGGTAKISHAPTGPSGPQLGEPNNNLITPEHYNELFTLHGTTMIFLFVVPMMAGFANYFLPLMIGARIAGR